MHLETLKEKIIRCKKCPLHKERNHAVPGEGKTGSIMIIGEAPGKEEDQQGKPFIGRSGQLLIKLLSDINLSRKDLFITNIVKCRPAQNQDPKKKEIEICTKLYLFNQIRLIRPKILLLIGRVPTSTLFKHFKISYENLTSVHGKKFTVKELTLIPLFHPAAALRSTKIRNLMEEDFQILKDLLKNSPY